MDLGSSGSTHCWHFLIYLYPTTKRCRNLISYVTVRLNESQGAGNVCVSSSTCTESWGIT
ncbi:hypothetical protein HBI56_218750 [Parastagonospora nodorum]|uniref:Uncharacterized protein n=1 Tax=Phaeosphaeria nodorum (strain SN15 / ATCC MYA-4574 / FGSC 10173) TaxID=321614 RepID=A0A7U2FAT9_PHANO|nr:hypothetical protein HBH56_225310 [Parastagonospora nodorum]QRD01877.1 hypothetical protein JI435_417300 [Parastagonospora nodorum SN15]KAH3935426.1 hypothetical protein HBH54_033420 [Parastagonospora nodorum]KAH3940085.1 hypothetical protein HBH53_223340 [Parastagonospora nodorum]KAH3957589.1 hypothetical protein HBH51_223360 [Parastagonospora nodorum]